MNEIELWAARDKSGTLSLYRHKPTKDKFEWYSLGLSLALASASFPEVQWSDDEPKNGARIFTSTLATDAR